MSINTVQQDPGRGKEKIPSIMLVAVDYARKGWFFQGGDRERILEAAKRRGLPHDKIDGPSLEETRKINAQRREQAARTRRRRP